MSSTVPSTQVIDISALKSLITSCMRGDVFRFSQRLRRASTIDKNKQQAFLVSLKQEVEASVLLRQQRAENCPSVEYPDLPVSAHKNEISEAIKQNQVVIIAGETGSGKTTQIPKICIELGRGISGLIGHTQPRRLAARTVANRIAEELKSPLGHHVGFKIRFSDQVSQHTHIN